MSRGHGNRQREILAAVENAGERGLWLTDILPASYSRSEYVATHRAASKLSDDGLIDIVMFMHGKNKFAMYPRGLGLVVDGRGKRPPE